MRGRPAQPRLRAGGQTALKHGHETRSTFWGERLGYLWDMLNPEGLRRSRGPEGGQTHGGVWDGGYSDFPDFPLCGQGSPNLLWGIGPIIDSWLPSMTAVKGVSSPLSGACKQIRDLPTAVWPGGQARRTH